MSARLGCVVRSLRSRRGLSALTLALTILAASPLLAVRTLKDELGNPVVVPDHPHRIVCLIPSVVDDVYALGAGEDVIAVSDFTRYPAAARGKPSIGLPLSPSLEMIVALHPDLVLGSADLNRPETARQLSRLGIAAFMVNPHGLSGVYRSLLSLGLALNREAAAHALIEQLKAQERSVRERAAQRPQVRVFLPVWYDPIVTIGGRSFLSELIETAGAVSITDSIAQEWPQISLEVVMAHQPDALVLIKDGKVTFHDLENRPGWDTLPAVRNRRVYYLDDRAEFPSPIAFQALEDFEKQLNP